MDLLDDEQNYATLEEYDEPEYTRPSDRPEAFIVPAIFAFIYIVGILGNGTLVIMFLHHRSMKNIPNTYIFSLALAALIFILVCVPVSGLLYTLEEWIWGEAMCKITEFGKDAFYGVSIFTLTALTTERFYISAHPLQKLQTKPLPIKTAIFMWILAIICATPAAIVSKSIDLQVGNMTTSWTITICQPYGDPTEESTPRYAKYNEIYKAIIYYILPLCIIGVLYVQKVHVAKRFHVSPHTSDVSGEIAGLHPKAARIYLPKKDITLILVFMVCLLPQHIFNLWFFCNPNSTEEYDNFWHIFRIVGLCLSHLSSCLNPIALYCVSGAFRQHFHRCFCCKVITSKKHLFTSTTSDADNHQLTRIHKNES